MIVVGAEMVNAAVFPVIEVELVVVAPCKNLLKLLPLYKLVTCSVGISIGLCLFPVAHTPVQSFPIYL